MNWRTQSALALFLLGCALVSSGLAVAQPPPPSYTVIVNARNPVERLGREDLAALFLKQATRWGEARSAVGLAAGFSSVQVEPVDQQVGSSVRSLFSVHLLGRQVSQVETYWDQLAGGGEGSAAVPPPGATQKTRPPVLASDAAVQRYVAAHPGAIGYISGGARLIQGVKEVGVLPAR